jgi:hypothetical protein
MRRSGVVVIFIFVALFGLASRASAAAMVIGPPTSTTFTVGTAKTFNGTTNGGVGTTLTKTGTLPSALAFADAGGGNFTISGTAATGTEGNYPITITAAGGANTGSATFTVIVASAPKITSASSATFTTVAANTFTVTTTGGGTMVITETGALPSGVALTQTAAQQAAGTATLSGTPAVTGVFPITITASNGVGTAASQAFTLTVASAPATCQTLDANQQPRSRFVRGDRFFVKGILPGSGGTVSIAFNNVTNIGSGRQNEDGSYLVAAQIPSDAGFGGNTVVAKKLTASATCGINVVSAGGGGVGRAAAAAATPRPATTLPRTGSPILPMGVAGLLFLGTGAGMLLYYRRQAFALLSVVWTEADVFFAREENRVKSLFTGLVRKTRR